MASDHHNALDSVNQTEPHTTASSGGEHRALEPETSDSSRAASEQVHVGATELTSLSTCIRIDGHACGYGSMAQEATTRQDAGRDEAETAVFRSSDMSKNTMNPAVGSSLNHGAELTKEGPPSYESVVKGRAPVIPESNNCDDVVTTQPLSSSTVSQPAVDANLPDVASSQSAPEIDSSTEQLNRNPESTHLGCTCCQFLSDCCDACGRCCESDEMRCFCEVSWEFGSKIISNCIILFSFSLLSSL